TAKPIDVTVEQSSFAGTFHIDYRGGEQFPHLQRIDGRPDLLSEIMRPHARVILSAAEREGSGRGNGSTTQIPRRLRGSE
ncbi:MAG TPA: hypothetical protein VF505_16630, partial [Thermoanaerobaculia bacterium]